jgi:hypothetical protein
MKEEYSREFGQWNRVEDHPIPTDRPSLIMLKDQSMHVGYPHGFRIWDGERWDPDNKDWQWIVGGWECCHYCGGESAISMNGEGHTKKAIFWMELPKPAAYFVEE